MALKISTPPRYILIKVNGPFVCSICKQSYTGQPAVGYCCCPTFFLFVFRSL